ncbi:MAG TPA: twin-arginine translocase TatA/TatE family subunit [Streptosporangiaceae bacterium]
MSFFDAPWHIVLLLLVALVLFGSSRLPGASDALAKSIRIFKKSMKSDDDQPGHQDQVSPSASQPGYSPAPPGQITSGPAAPAQQAQIDALQRQLNDLQRQQSATADAPSQSRPS